MLSSTEGVWLLMAGLRDYLCTPYVATPRGDELLRRMDAVASWITVAAKLPKPLDADFLKLGNIVLLELQLLSAAVRVGVPTFKVDKERKKKAGELGAVPQAAAALGSKGKGGKKGSGKGSKGTKGQIVCFKCGQPGHTAAMCPNA
eukprot:TRINITY_DN3758_c1_g1_i1.p4 TRINITY_DN3758_c1_g1~~TRINITY_DN3758_c1_g1_i1.p4  ORF type:complete len:146 (-),score=33.64 TRINITY_DN3758_c1_g1_i1:1190-1627(-)